MRSAAREFAGRYAPVAPGRYPSTAAVGADDVVRHRIVRCAGQCARYGRTLRPHRPAHVHPPQSPRRAPETPRARCTGNSGARCSRAIRAAPTASRLALGAESSRRAAIRVGASAERPPRGSNFAPPPILKVPARVYATPPPLATTQAEVSRAAANLLPTSQVSTSPLSSALPTRTRSSCTRTRESTTCVAPTSPPLTANPRRPTYVTYTRPRPRVRPALASLPPAPRRLSPPSIPLSALPASTSSHSCSARTCLPPASPLHTRTRLQVTPRAVRDPPDPEAAGVGSGPLRATSREGRKGRGTRGPRWRRNAPDSQAASAAAPLPRSPFPVPYAQTAPRVAGREVAASRCPRLRPNPRTRRRGFVQGTR
ncbi:hypothetical protein B0H15DRAFT_818284 [Mycena belliarum]|uniref:Uncharacterized protein n=1 Tax=Mycena belliarum TaxID=1033014 RepID=A0AAD6XVZ2_9AGAR|nr:hypothetical protein B0H15DRAFT_818284 [Mycena belliae]